MSSVRAIIAGHGDFADGMLSAIEQIAGRSEAFLGLTNRGLSAADVEALMRERLDTTGVSVVFTDLPAGSCTMAARRLQRERPGLSIVTGVNLAALLDFVFGTDGGDADAVAHAVEKGRAALVVAGTSRGS
jgi:PTS system N-acetylgalactosamine-specific IIA component